MNRYLMIESRGPFDADATASFTLLAQQLAGAGHAVTMMLVHNGVLPARRGATHAPLAALRAAGVKVLADAFSLKERGIAPEALATGVEASALDVVIDDMAGGARTIWH